MLTTYLSSRANSGEAAKVEQPAKKLTAKRFAVLTLSALLAFSFSITTACALPISTNETLEHAAALKQAPTYHAQIELGTDSTRQMGLMEWKSASPSEAYLVCVHAWGLSAREFNGFGEQMARRGFNTVAIDVRGFGLGRKEKGAKRIDFEGTDNDIVQIIKSLKKKAPDKKIFVVGESMGGAIALRVGAQHPELVDGVICSAPAWQIFQVRKITMEGLVDQIFGEPGLAARSVASMASSNKELHRRWLSDQVYRTNYSVPEAYSYYRLMRATPKCAEGIRNVPVLVMQGSKDKLSKPEASAKLFKMIDNNNNKQFAIVAGAEHLVLEENQLTQPVADFVQNWILSRLNEAGKTAEAPHVVVIEKDKLPLSEERKIQRLKQMAGST